jgi:Tol biopolymer transport system component
VSAPAPRLTSALADRYRIERELGAGGMATVYLAQDLKHDRKVAVKVLRPELAAVIGADRFLSEIKTTANLQHPHILPLFDSGAADSFLFYVMPFIDGESLRDRLNREKQLSINDAVRIATEVAGALDYAHRHGVIHRDIKPENILLHDGRALVADFGIALAASKAGGSRMTETGMSLGTPHYMSPEQAMGEREITARSDVYALGCVLYEMLTGDPPFTGSTAQAIVARVLTETPRPITAQRRTIPPQVEAAVLTALEKLPADRFATAAQFAQALGDPGFVASGIPAARPARRGARAMVPRGWLGLALAANLLLIAAALLIWRRAAPEQGTSRQQVLLWQHDLPDPLDPGATTVASQAAIAPDGSSIVYSDSSAGGLRLMRKLRGAAEGTPIAGTEGAVSPFFSPDGRWIAYMTIDGKLRKVPTTGGGSVTLSEVSTTTDYKIGAWLDDQTIVFSDRRRWLSRISADGGPVKPLTQPGNALASTISALPGSKGVLFTFCNGNCAVQSDIYVYDFAGDSSRLVVPQAAGAWYSPTGHLLYTSRDGGLYAAEFDPNHLMIRGGATPVIDNVAPTRFTLSASGAILYSIDPVSSGASDLVWVTRDGKVSPVDSTWHGRFQYPALSPDGTALAVSVREKLTDLWIRRANGTRQKVIAGGLANWRACWMPDGKEFGFVSVRSAEGSTQDVRVYRARADGSGNPELLLQHRFGVWECEVSHDGRRLIVRSDEEEGNGHIYVRRLDGDTALIPLVVGEHTANQPVLSPDGRWLAYVSDELGSGYDVYVASFPDMGSKQMISQGGGVEPRWARNGRELFFKSRGQLMAVSVPPGPTFSPGDPHPLFSLAGFRAARNRPQYDVAPDGRFVMIRDAGAAGTLVYAEHWFDELRAKLRR